MAPKSERHIVARLFANAATKLALATIIAAFCLTVVPIDGAAADVQISAARARFNSAAAWPHDILLTTGVTPNPICIGPAWRDMIKKNDCATASGELIAQGNDANSVFCAARYIVLEQHYAQRAGLSP
jgi:hypothetical protein